MTLLIGVGNPYRRDDGAGLAVLDLLGFGRESTGDPADLLAAWDGADRVVLVDAVSTGAPAGTVTVLSCREGTWEAAAAASTHGLGVAEAVALGSALGSLPSDLVLVGVEAADCGYGEGLSAPVAAAVARAADVVRGLIPNGPTRTDR